MIDKIKTKFTVYDREEASVLEIIESLAELNNDVVDELINKTDLHGDHKGSWQGLSKPTLSDEGMRATVEKMLNDEMFNLLETTSIISDDMIDYSYADIERDINLLAEKYKGKLTKELIGKSVLGRNINALIIGNINGSNKLLVFSGHHAREQHMANIILRQIEFYCENWNRTVEGEKLEEIFKNSAIFFIPCINPDGLEICRIGLDSIPIADTERRNKIKSALEYKVRNNLLLNKDVNENWDLFSNVSWVGEKGTLSTYTFRNEDLKMWKSNANGIDLHYNCWESNVNEDVVKNYAASSNFPSTFASENYIGTEGMVDENKLLKNFITKYGLGSYSISYHGKGPTVFWNYKLKGKQFQRNHEITRNLCDISNTVYSESNNARVGFTGYMYAKYTSNLTYCCVRETGWGTNEINKDNNYTDPLSGYTVCPLPKDQLKPIWKAEKFIPLYMLKKYVRRQDLKVRHNNVCDVDFEKSTKNSNLDFVNKNHITGEIVQGGVKTIEFTGQNYQALTFDLQEPFKKVNRGGYVNCYSNTKDIIQKVKNLAITRDSLSRVTIRVFLDSNLGSDSIPYTLPVNFIIYGE